MCTTRVERIGVYHVPAKLFNSLNIRWLVNVILRWHVILLNNTILTITYRYSVSIDCVSMLKVLKADAESMPTFH